MIKLKHLADLDDKIMEFSKYFTKEENQVIYNCYLDVWGYLESDMPEQMQESYKKAEFYINKYLREHGIDPDNKSKNFDVV